MRRHWVVCGMGVLVLIAACGESSRPMTTTAPTPAPSPTQAPTLPSVTNYTGDWGGLYWVRSCTDSDPQRRYCAFNLNTDSDPMRLTLRDIDGVITGRMQTRGSIGDVRGAVDAQGFLHLEGSLHSETGPTIHYVITEWRTEINRATDALDGDFTVRHLWGNDGSSAAISVNRIGIGRCTNANLSWQCN